MASRSLVFRVDGILREGDGMSLVWKVGERLPRRAMVHILPFRWNRLGTTYERQCGGILAVVG